MRLICLTSNAYTRFIPGFAFYFNRFWSDKQGVLLVGYDQLPPLPLPRNFAFISLGRQDHYTWTAGLLALLSKVQDNVLALFLEDYYLERPVDTERIYELERYMLARPQVAKIDLTDDRLKTPYDFFSNGDASGLIRSHDDAPFQTSLQAALWRREFLMQFLKEPESPWQFEKMGTRRVIAARRAGAFDGLILGCQRPPVRYVNAVGGGQGEKDQGGGQPVWALKRIPSWMQGELKARGWLHE